MTEERKCVVCPTRRRTAVHYERPHVCQPCRIWLAETIADIAALYIRLVDLPRTEVDGPWKVLQRYKGHWVTQNGHDPVASTMPTNADGRTPPRLGIVTGSREAQTPINVDRVDLTLPPHGDRLTADGRQWWEDQIGHLSVAMELDLIARAWSEQLHHRLPEPTVTALAGWLADRAPWACDTYPGIDTAATTLSRIRATLLAMLGEVPPRPERMGAPCPSCDLMTLVRRPGESRVECATDDCRRVLTAEDYDQWGRMVLAQEIGNVTPA